MREEDRTWATLAHAVAAIPLWGVMGDVIIWLSFKERSREVVFHAQQAIFFQIGFLAIALMGIIVSLFEGIMRLINETLAQGIHAANAFFIVLCGVVYIAVCLYGAWTTWSGRDFLYPIIGKRMAAGFRRHLDD